MPMRHIAEALGYADLSVLTRAFKRWSGETPTEWAVVPSRAIVQTRVDAMSNRSPLPGKARELMEP